METIIKNTLSSDAFFMVNKTLLKYLGSANAAILLASFVSKHKYFEKQGTLEYNSFFNTKEMIMEDTGLTEQSILRAERLLEKLGLIKTQLKSPVGQCKRVKYYTLQWDHMSRIMNGTLPAESVVDTVDTNGTLQLESLVSYSENIAGNDNHLIITNEQQPDNNNKGIIMGDGRTVLGRVPKNRSLHSNPTVSRDLELAGVTSIDEYFDKWDD